MKEYAIRFLSLATLIFLVAQGLISAQENFERIVIVHTFNPVAIPGRVLAPGNYMFRLLNGGGPQFVSVDKADGSRHFGFFMVLPANRATRAGNAIDLSQPGQGDVARITRFFFPDDKTGYQFKYTARELQEIQAATRHAAAGSPSGL